MKKLVLSICVLIGFGSALMAQQIPYSFIEANNVRGRILGNGSLFHTGVNNEAPSWEVPKGSGLSTLFQQSLWVGGLESGQLHLAGQRFGQDGEDYWSGPLRLEDATTTPEMVEKFSHVWNVTKAEIEAFIAHHGEAGYTVPDDILTWPAHGDEGYANNLAPFVDVDGNGIYQPENGDYPDIKGDQCLFFIFNDSYLDHTEFGGEKLGIEVHAMVYAYATPQDEALNNTVFFDYKIFNRSDKTYTDAYVGLWNDWDVGNGWDDYVGCEVHRSATFAYNGNTVDNYYGENPPAQVCKVLAGPFMDPDGIDNPAYDGDCASLDGNAQALNGMNFGNGVVDDERLGMASFISTLNGSEDNGDPQNAAQAYNNLLGLWKEGNPMSYGGNGLEGTVGPACHYQYPGDTDPCNVGTEGVAPNGGFNEAGHYWTETEAGNIPNDRRGLTAMGPFTFAADAMQEIEFSVITVFANEKASAFERIGEYIDRVASFSGYPTTSVMEHGETNGESLKLYPNPTHDQFNVEGTGHLTVTNVLGQQVRSMEIDGITPVKLPEGIYFLRLEQENSVKTAKVVVR
ncbi:MAG: T9SS type A sorting domain-containing protein [Bacteroidales bacterium]|nr:T9SS type A sorting domain-containing protein [Bacteroidales bacterium]